MTAKNETGISDAVSKTYDWTQSDVDRFFVTMNQGGEKLKQGELIHAKRDSIFTTIVSELAHRYLSLFENSAEEGGFSLPKKNILRYQHFELLGAIIHMVRTEEFPSRPGQTSLAEFNLWDDPSEETLLNDYVAMAETLIELYQHVMANVPRLKQKLGVPHHLRAMYFLMKQDMKLETMNQEVYRKLDKMLTTDLKQDNPVYGDTVKWGTEDCMKIYDKYVELYQFA